MFKDAFQKLSLILKNRNISMTTKFRVLKTYVWSTLTLIIIAYFTIYKNCNLFVVLIILGRYLLTFKSFFPHILIYE